MSNMGKGAGYYLTRSKSLLIDTAIVAILAIFMSFAMQMDALQSKGEDYLVLMLYAVIFGLTSLQSGAMIVDLTAKDECGSSYLRHDLSDELWGYFREHCIWC